MNDIIFNLLWYTPMTLLQKVMKSCKWLYLSGCNTFDCELVAIQFIQEEWFTTNEKNVAQSMRRRMFELVAIWLLEVSEKDKQQYYKLTNLGKKVNIDKIHLWYTLILRDNKITDTSKWNRKTRKNRKSKTESEVIQENDLINKIIESKPNINIEQKKKNIWKTLLSYITKQEWNKNTK